MLPSKAIQRSPSWVEAIVTNDTYANSLWFSLTTADILKRHCSSRSHHRETYRQSTIDTSYQRYNFQWISKGQPMTWLVLKTDKVWLTNQGPCFSCLKWGEPPEPFFQRKRTVIPLRTYYIEGQAAEILMVTSALPILYFMYGIFLTSYAIGTWLSTGI